MMGENPIADYLPLLIFLAPIIVMRDRRMREIGMVICFGLDVVDANV